MGNEKNKKIPFYTNNGQNNKSQRRNFQTENNKSIQKNGSYNNKEIEKIMKKIKEEGYRSKEKTILRKELVSNEAENIAKELKKEKLSKSQLRSFFNEINKLKLKYIEDNKEEDQEKLENLGIELLILKSKLEYKKGKNGNDKLPENFYIFMKESIDYIVENDKKIYFKDFKIFFETVVGYTYGLGGVNDR